MSMDCGDENELLAYVEGLLPPERGRAVERHADECTACRLVIAGLASGRVSAGRSSGSSRPPLPARILHEYLKRDAPNREMALARFWATVALLGVVAMRITGRALGPHLSIAGAGTLGLFFAYEATMYFLLRRGWFHRSIPLVSTLVENAVFLAIHVNLTRFAPPGIISSPGTLIWIVSVVFSAIRANPSLCLVAGGMGAIGYALPFVFGLAPENFYLPVPFPMIAASAFFLVAGLAGATMARYLVSRAEHALHEIREQDLFGKYLLHEPLGTGGMGQVFRATYTPEGGFIRTVAVKRMRSELSEDRSFQEAFRAEARLCAQLAHPNLVQVLDCGTFRGAFVLVMEYVDGIALSRLLQKGPLPISAAVFLGIELAAALDYLHSRRGPDGAPLGLVHCDLNPPNVMVSTIGEVKLCDFGVARTLLDVRRQTFAGKTMYAAPEQLRGDALDGRADLFALGLTLYEALTAKPAFAPEETAMTAKISRPSRSRPDVPGELDELIEELTRVNRAARPAAAATVRKRLLSIQAALAPLPSGEDLLAKASQGARSSADEREASLPTLPAGSIPTKQAKS